jgi:hypothetical protein
VIKTKRIRWAEKVARTGENRNAYRILVGKDLGIDGRIILKTGHKEIGWEGINRTGTSGVLL